MSDYNTIEGHMNDSVKIQNTIHSFNAIVGLALKKSQRQTILSSLLSGTAIPMLAVKKLAEAPAISRINELESILTDVQLNMLVNTLGDDGFAEAFAIALYEMNGHPTPILDENAENPWLTQPAPAPPDGSWDVAMICQHTQSLTTQVALLRKKVLISIQPPEPALGGHNPIPLPPSLQAQLTGSELEEKVHSYGSSMCSQPPCHADLIQRITDQVGPLSQLILLEMVQDSVNPTLFRHSQNADKNHKITREQSWQTIGTHLLATVTSMGHPGLLGEIAQPRLSTATPSISSNWQIRSKWRLKCCSLIPSGPQIKVLVSTDLQGAVTLQGHGQRAAHLSASGGLFAATFSGESCLSQIGDQTPSLPAWSSGRDFGSGVLTIRNNNSERRLTDHGIQTHERRIGRPLIRSRIANSQSANSHTSCQPLGDHLDTHLVFDQSTQVYSDPKETEVAGHSQCICTLTQQTTVTVTDSHNEVIINLGFPSGESHQSKDPPTIHQTKGVRLIQTAGQTLHVNVGDVAINGNPAWEIHWINRFNEGEVTWVAPSKGPARKSSSSAAEVIEESARDSLRMRALTQSGWCLESHN